MGQTVIDLGDQAELVIDEPNSQCSQHRATVITIALLNEFGGATNLGPAQRSGSVSLTIGYSLYRIYYQLRVKRVLSALTAYSEAIRHIQENIYLYDYRLARKAIEVLRECHRKELKS